MITVTFTADSLEEVKKQAEHGGGLANKSMIDQKGTRTDLRAPPRRPGLLRRMRVKS